MDMVARTFDRWATSGRAEKMEIEHGRSVAAFLGSVRLGRSFTFLDVGCGNGWVTRMVAAMPGCRGALGIDKSAKMVRRARAASDKSRARFERIGLEDLGRRRFGHAFAMESIYYADSVPAALRRVYSLLEPGGRFFCGTDYYAENAASARWPRMVGLAMHRYSVQEWKGLFRDAGFAAASRHVRDPSSAKKWRREWGTLFVTGKKPR